MILPLLLLAAQAAQPAVAQVPPGLLRADTNRDGVITRAEAQATAVARFARVDTDRDGSIAPHERRVFREAARVRPITAAQFQQRAQARFARLDTNRDGVLSGDERGAKPRGKHGHHGPHAGGPDGPRHGGMKGDRPRPGIAITAAQFRDRALARFDGMDANRDGRVDRAEVLARRVARRG
jgi:hypothetical protein